MQIYKALDLPFLCLMPLFLHSSAGFYTFLSEYYFANRTADESLAFCPAIHLHKNV